MIMHRFLCFSRHFGWASSPADNLLLELLLFYSQNGNPRGAPRRDFNALKFSTMSKMARSQWTSEPVLWLQRVEIHDGDGSEHDRQSERRWCLSFARTSTLCCVLGVGFITNQQFIMDSVEISLLVSTLFLAKSTIHQCQQEVRQRNAELLALSQRARRLEMEVEMARLEFDSQKRNDEWDIYRLNGTAIRCAINLQSFFAVPLPAYARNYELSISTRRWKTLTQVAYRCPYSKKYLLWTVTICGGALVKSYYTASEASKMDQVPWTNTRSISRRRQGCRRIGRQAGYYYEWEWPVDDLLFLIHALCWHYRRMVDPPDFHGCCSGGFRGIWNGSCVVSLSFSKDLFKYLMKGDKVGFGSRNAFYFEQSGGMSWSMLCRAAIILLLVVLQKAKENW